MPPALRAPGVAVFCEDALDVLRRLPDESFDAVVTDPPYGLEFMGKEWDRFGKNTGNGYQEKPRWGGDRDNVTNADDPRKRSAAPNYYTAGAPFQQWCTLWAAECLRVLKPGGHMLVFGGTRTFHRLGCAIEDAGFEIRDSIAWLYGSGFPKSRDISKDMDKAAGVEREVLHQGAAVKRMIPGADQNATGSWIKDNGREFVPTVTAPATPEAEQWQGWGTALKPAFEPIIVARKPFKGTIAANVLEHGTGAININASRIAYEEGGSLASNPSLRTHINGGNGGHVIAHETERRVVTPNGSGRWPANVVLSHLDECEQVGLTEVKSDGHHPASRGPGGLSTYGHSGQDALVERKSGTEVVSAWRCAPGCQVAVLDGQSGIQRDGVAVQRNRSQKNANPHGIYGSHSRDADADLTYGGGGGASRFFYCAKASKKERPVAADGSMHPTVKPLALMRWLVRLVTPPGGRILEPFAGSGTTIEAAILEGFPCIAVESEPSYLEFIQQRIDRSIPKVA